MTDSFRRLIFAALLIGLTPTVSSPSWACSICRCGEPTFNALGISDYLNPGLRVAFDWERFDKDEGDAEEEAESQVENRLTTFLSYAFAERFVLSVRIPYSNRELRATAAGEGSETVSTRGISDPEIYGQALLWASPMSSVGQRASVVLAGGVKTPWGENEAVSDGERVDEHAQPGTGSTDVFGNIDLLYLVNLRSSLFSSIGYRHTGENDYGYRYGSTFLANLAYEHRIGQSTDGVMELNFRHAAKDRIDSDGAMGDDTGGSLLYVTPKLLFDFTQGVVLRMGAQIPTLGSLNGEQTERIVANVGLTYLFAH